MAPPKPTSNRCRSLWCRVGLAGVCGWTWGPATGVAQEAQPEPTPPLLTPWAAESSPVVEDPWTLPVESTSAPLVPPWWTASDPSAEMLSGAQLGTSTLAGLDAPPPPLAGAAGGPSPALRWGPVTAQPFFSYGITYSDGLGAGVARDESSLIHRISPGVTLLVGEQWSVSYTPSIVVYSTDLYRTTVNHSASVQGGTQYGEWQLGAANQFSLSDNPLIETGTQTEQTVNTTSLTAGRPLSPVLSLDLGVTQSLRWASEFNETFSWSTLNWINYQLRPRTSVGLGVGGGYDRVNPGSDMTSERVMARWRGALGDKVTYGLSGGFSFRQFLDTDAPTHVSPVLDASINYQVTEKTSFSAFFGRDASPSYFRDEFTESLFMGGGFQQRLLGRISWTGSATYRMTENRSTFDPDLETDSDTYLSLRTGLSARVLRRGSLSLFYQWSDNDSDAGSRSYTSRQVGLQMSYRF